MSDYCCSISSKYHVHSCYLFGHLCKSFYPVFERSGIQYPLRQGEGAGGEEGEEMNFFDMINSA